jgi:hypothetical protein
MDDSERLFSLTEESKFNRLLVKSVVFGVLGFIGICVTGGYACNRQDDLAKIQIEQAGVAKVQSVNALEKAKVETEKARLDLERAIFDRQPAKQP